MVEKFRIVCLNTRKQIPKKIEYPILDESIPQLKERCRLLQNILKTNFIYQVLGQLL
jgi:hypothetical protein